MRSERTQRSKQEREEREKRDYWVEKRNRRKGRNWVVVIARQTLDRNFRNHFGILFIQNGEKKEFKNEKTRLVGQQDEWLM